MGAAQRARAVLARARTRGTPPSAPPPEAPAADAEGRAQPAPAAAPIPVAWPPGHFYSPVPDVPALLADPARTWPTTPPETPGIDWRPDAQVALVRAIGAQAEMPFPDGPTGDPADYHTGNGFFSVVDAWALQGVLRELRPRRVIEIGSGWSSLVTARVNREHLGGAAHVTCIEPHPPDWLKGDGVPGIAEVRTQPVQDVTLEVFDGLADGDVLFIDSSHVAKTGSDVTFLYGQVLPRLAPGVAVHVHDVFLPWDYPRAWLAEGRAWNEQYLVQAFLAHNAAWEVVLGVSWFMTFRRDELMAAGPAGWDPEQAGGGSLWLRRRAG